MRRKMCIFFSTVIDGRNLIFRHKLHIQCRYPISWEAFFGPIRFLLPVCRLCWFLFTLNIYAHFSSHFSQQLLIINSYWEKCDEKYLGRTEGWTEVKQYPPLPLWGAEKQAKYYAYINWFSSFFISKHQRHWYDYQCIFMW
jgi:hypothetical protein